MPAERKEKMVAVNKVLHKKYTAMRQASRGIRNTYATETARELHHKFFYTDYRPDPSEDLILVPHPLLR